MPRPIKYNKPRTINEVYKDLNQQKDFLLNYLKLGNDLEIYYS